MIRDPGGCSLPRGRPWSERLAEPVDGAVSRPIALRLAALLHDIAKPDTRSVREDGRVCFMDTRGGRPESERICRRLRTSENLARLVGAVVEQHLTLGFLLHQQPLPEALSDRVPVGGGAMGAGSDPGVDGGSPGHPGRVDARARTCISTSNWQDASWRGGGSVLEGGRAPCPLDGRRLAGELGLVPGPTLGRALREVRLAWEAGEAGTHRFRGGSGGAVTRRSPTGGGPCLSRRPGHATIQAFVDLRP